MTSSAPATSQTLRSAFSLTMREGLLGFAVGATAWLLLRQFFAVSFAVPLVLCNTLALSAVCARRYLRREEAPALSRFGYGAFAHPLLQAVLFIGVVAAGGMSVGSRVTLVTVIAIGAFVAALVAHIATAGAATVRGLRSADCRGEISALPLCLVWLYALGLIVFNNDPTLKAINAARVRGATEALRPVQKHDVSMDKFAEAWAAQHKLRPAQVHFYATWYDAQGSREGFPSHDAFYQFGTAALFEVRNGKFIKRVEYRPDAGELIKPALFDRSTGLDIKPAVYRDPTWDDRLKPIQCKDTVTRVDIGADGRAGK